MTADIVWIDTETTSLANPWLRHGRRVWEVAACRVHGVTGEQRWVRLVVADLSLADADETALQLGGFYRRHPNGGGHPADGFRYLPERDVAGVLARLLWPIEATGEQVWFAGANPAFDAASVEEMLVRHGMVERAPWYHDLLDVEAYAAGALGLEPPWNSRTVAEALQVPRDVGGAAHQADNDVWWAMRAYHTARLLQREHA